MSGSDRPRQGVRAAWLRDERSRPSPYTGHHPHAQQPPSQHYARGRPPPEDGPGSWRNRGVGIGEDSMRDRQPYRRGGGGRGDHRPEEALPRRGGGAPRRPAYPEADRRPFPEADRRSFQEDRGTLEVSEIHLPEAIIEEGTTYEGYVYSCHDVHGFFIYFGHLDPHTRLFSRFHPHGRLGRHGLPSGIVHRLGRQVVGGRRSPKPSDMLRVQVKSKAADKEGRLLLELVLVPNRKLLILDMNGVLFNRYPPNDPRRHLHEVQRRPFLSEFLDLCFRAFDCAVWSACKRETMELEIFTAEQRESLVFIHDYSHTTNLWPRHSVVAPGKPLFIKDLPKLWREQYDRVLYGESNTLLLDNHLEKFEPNPVGTCIIVPDYDAGNGVEDRLLEMGGPLSEHLLALAGCRSLKDYFAAHADCAFFPPAHPTNPDLVKDTVRGDLLRLYCSSSCVGAEHSAEWYLSRQEAPGPRARQLRRRDVPALVRQRDAYQVCEKSDGVRYLLYARPPGQEPGGAFLVDRGLKVSVLHDGGEVVEALCGGGAALLDGELVQEVLTSHAEPSAGGQARTVYLVFDVVRLGGEDVGSCSGLQARLDCLRRLLAGRAGTLGMTLIDDNGVRTPVALRIKKMHPLAELESVAARLDKRQDGSSGGGHHVYLGQDEGESRSVVVTRSDGLVFTPGELQTYYQYQVYKFKFPEYLTVDFKLHLSDLPAIPPGTIDAEALPAIPLPLYLTSDSGKDLSFSTVMLSYPEVASLRQAKSTTSVAASGPVPFVLVECSFHPDAGAWKLRHIRTDKRKANSILSGWNTVEALAEHLELKTLLETVEQQRAAALLQPDDGGVASVAAHYDARQEERWSAEGLRDGKAIENLRKMNNWIKGMFLELACRGRLAEFAGDLAATRAAFDLSAFVPRANPFAEVSAQAPSKTAKARPRQLHLNQEEPFTVLDLACGRGGDLTKWSFLRAHTYVGVDVSPQSVAECKERLCQLRQAGRGYPKRGNAVVMDVKDPSLVEIARREGDTERFSVISMQFAVHYLCSSLDLLAAFFASVGSLLRPDGLLLLTTMDQRALHYHLSRSSAGTPPAVEFGNPVYQVCFSPSTTPGDLVGNLGVRYTFTLKSAVVDCPEYVVDLETIVKVAREVGGLECVAMQNFGDFAVACKDEFSEQLHRFGVKSVTDSEWEAVQLYCLMAFARRTE